MWQGQNTTNKPLNIKPSLDNLHILIVDNDLSNADTLGRGLYLFNYNSSNKVTPAEAVRLLEESQGRLFDLIITEMDLGSNEALDLMLAVEDLDHEVPIIAISSNTYTSRINAVQDMGLSILPKPFDMDKLDFEIRRLAHSKEMAF